MKPMPKQSPKPKHQVPLQRKSPAQVIIIQRWVPKALLRAQTSSSWIWVPKQTQPNRRGGVLPPPHTQSTAQPEKIWQRKTNTSLMTTHQAKQSTDKRFDSLTLERMSAPASTANAHGPHCSMTPSVCTASISHAFKHSEVVRVNLDLAQTLVFPPMHVSSDSTSNCCPEDNKQEGGSNWWSTMRKTLRNTSLQVFAKE